MTENLKHATAQQIGRAAICVFDDDYWGPGGPAARKQVPENLRALISKMEVTIWDLLDVVSQAADPGQVFCLDVEAFQPECLRLRGLDDDRGSSVHLIRDWLELESSA